MIQFHDLRLVGDALCKAWLAVLADNLRTSDLAEIEATSEHDPLLVLVLSVMLSEMAWVITASGEPIAIFGCGGIDQPPGQALVWMLGTPAMDERRNALAIGRATMPFIDQMQAVFPRLWNHIDARHTKSLRWLRWAGFTVFDVCPGHGRNGELFFAFERTTTNQGGTIESVTPSP